MSRRKRTFYSFPPTLFKFSQIITALDAARLVVKRWDDGDLAEAVRDLDKALHALDDKEYKP